MNFLAKLDDWINASRALGTWSFFDDRFAFKIRFDLAFDATGGFSNSAWDDAVGSIDGSLDVRRVRVIADGHVRDLLFRFSAELGSDRGLKDAYVEGKEEGVKIWGFDFGKLRLGFAKEPFSLERQTGFDSLSFLERSLPVGTFAPGHNAGLTLYDSRYHNRLTWAFGLYSFGQETSDNNSSSSISFTARTTFLPMFEDESHFLHLGASYSSREPRSGSLQYRSRPEAQFTNWVVDTGEISASGNTLIGIEAAYLNGRNWIQGEYLTARVSATDQANPNFSGAYVEIGRNLTGEIRPYNTETGIFGLPDAIQPYARGTNPFDLSQGRWSVTARLSRVDLDDAEIAGGTVTDITGGLSWEPSHYHRFQLNYIYSELKNSGRASIILLRYRYTGR